MVLLGCKDSQLWEINDQMFKLSFLGYLLLVASKLYNTQHRQQLTLTIQEEDRETISIAIPVLSLPSHLQVRATSIILPVNQSSQAIESGSDGKNATHIVRTKYA